MKRTAQMQKLEEMLRSSRIVSGGFLGDDPRPIEEIIETDLGTLEELGYDQHQIAQRMVDLGSIAVPRLGLWVDAGGNLEVRSEDYKGSIICPWPHSGRFDKRFTCVRQKDSGKEIRWTDLQVHMIDEHGFFEGRGSNFRIEPAVLVDVIM